ncbi:type II toxin-antitoxin system PemK/MazF family toxin [Microlunatus ginsengisoli]|uniref:PemK-like, MazF-like toxin of type II toxin-antitoxin system n=1 Tax=Microlunatus ginsengisoli TaxID=363863 RepID=A0ABP7A9E7_9ACTN
MALISRLRRLLRPRRAAAPVSEPAWSEYAPRRDGKPDPGEVVWAWVPFDENDGRGKDRPVLVLTIQRDEVRALMLTSKDHHRDAADEARWGRYWMDVGSGPWDRKGRPSEVRLDRLLRLPIGAVRREGAALDRATYLLVVEQAQRVQRSRRT